MFYKIFASRDRNMRQSVATCRCEVLLSSASAVTTSNRIRINKNTILGFIKEAISFLLKPLRINILKGYFKSFFKVIGGEDKDSRCFREYRVLQTPRHLLLDYNLYREERRKI